jgi:hypothetical protein
LIIDNIGESNFQILYENGVQRLHSFIFLAAFATVIVLTSTFVLIPKFKITPRKQLREERTVGYKDKEEVAVIDGKNEDVGNGKADNTLRKGKGNMLPTIVWEYCEHPNIDGI